MNRGARRATIFLDDECCGRFLTLVGELPDRFGIAVHGFTLMPNHFHLLVESRSARLSQAMAYLQGQYARWLNRRYEWDGPLFRGRFRNRLVEDERYWRHLLAYIHLNPVRANLVSSPDRADWTSHGAYVGLAPRPSWLLCEDMLALYGGIERYQTYVRDVRYGREVPPETFDPDGIWSGPVSGLVALHLAAPPGEATRGPTWDGPTGDEPIDTALSELEQIVGRPREDILEPRQGRRDNRRRWVAAWWLTWSGRTSGVQAARALGVHRTGVSQMSAKARALRSEDPEIDAWMTELESLQRPS